MSNWVTKTLAWLAGIVLVVFICIWTVLWSPIFSDLRRTFLQDLLSEQIGQPLIIDGDVAVDLGPVTHILVHGARIPSENISELNLAELGVLVLEAHLAAWW